MAVFGIDFCTERVRSINPIIYPKHHPNTFFTSVDIQVYWFRMSLKPIEQVYRG
jgi:hypothetical protein